MNPWSVTIHQAVSAMGKNNEPVHLREALRETEPCHADMLRYDFAFCNPADVSQVVFPVFKTKDGDTQRNITEGRWSSFVLKLIPFSAEEAPANLHEWFTYVHGDRHQLVRMTYAEYVAAHPKNKLKGWR